MEREIGFTIDGETEAVKQTDRQTDRQTTDRQTDREVTHLRRMEISTLSCPSPCARSRPRPLHFSPSPIRAGVAWDRAPGYRCGPSSGRPDWGGAATRQAVPRSSRVSCMCVRVCVHFVSFWFTICSKGVCLCVLQELFVNSVHFKAQVQLIVF